MADRLRIIVDEIETEIRQTFDDKVVSKAQIAYWVIVVGNTILGQHNEKRDSGAFLSVFPEIPVKVAQNNSIPNIIKGRKYIELPGEIFDFNNDDGVEYIAYYNPDENCAPEYQKKTIQRTSPSKLQWLMLNKETKPSPKNPYWTRASKYIYFAGIEEVPVKFVEMGIYMTIDPLEKIDIDKPFPFPAERLHILKRQVTELARYSFLFPDNKINDGSDVDANKQMNIPKVTSVNDQQNQ